MKRILIVMLAIASLEYSFTVPHGGSTVSAADANQWVDSVFQTMTEDQKIGQLFMIRAHSNLGPDHIAYVKRQITDYYVGGLCFFQGTPERQIELLNEYQALSAQLPMMVAVDAEWGLGMRLKQAAISFPRQLMLGAIQNNRLIYQMGEEIARQLKLTGTYINFAPVADINNNADNPVIHTRSFGENRYNVTVKSYMYMLGMQDNQVLACAKHFPGHGDTDVDSHKDLPVINHSRSRLDSIELYPFRALIQHGIGSIMVAHMDVPELVESAGIPTSLSPNTITNTLRNEMAFDGLVFTDALDMKGVTKNFDPGRVEVEALKAGVDVLLIPTDINASIKAIKTALSTGELTWDRIDYSVKKILKNKYDLGLTRFSPLVVDSIRNRINTPEAKVLKRELIKEALTLVRNNDQLLPFTNYEGLKLASIAIGSSQKNTFQRRLDSYASFKHFQLSKRANQAQQQQIIDQVKELDAVVVGVHNMSSSSKEKFGLTENTLSFLDQLNKTTKVVLVLFGTPYSAGYFDHINQLMVAYEENEDVLDLAAQSLFGVFSLSGRLPVSASPKSQFNTGITTKKTYRLGFAIPESVGLNSDTLQLIDQIAQNAIDSGATPGCVVLVARHGQIVYQKAFGHHTYAKKRPVDVEDIYDLASITKVNASTLALMKLAEIGKININAPIGDYLPYLKGSNKENLILSDVLAHQSGLRSWIPFYKETVSGSRRRKRPSNAYYRPNVDGAFSIPITENLYLENNYIHSIWDQIRDSELPNLGQYYYSDLGFYLTARMIQNLTRQRIDQFVDEQFYQKLGLYNTGFLPWQKFDLTRVPPTELDRYFRRQKVHGYVHDMGAAMLGGVSGHAGLFSNAREVAIIMQMLLQNGQYGDRNFLHPEVIQRFTMRPSGSTRRGLGFDMKEMNTRRAANIAPQASLNAFGHYGFTGTAVWADPDHDLIYVFLSNRTFPSMNNYLLGRLNTRIRIQSLLYKALTTPFNIELYK